MNVDHLFEPARINVVLRKGSYVRPYVYDFIHRLVPTLELQSIRTILAS